MEIYASTRDGKTQPLCNAQRRAAVYQHEALRCCREHIWGSRSKFVDFCTVVKNNNRGKGRGRDLTILLSLLGVYANAEKVVLAHAPALKRAQRGDVVAAIAAKDAEAAVVAANDANSGAKALRENATPQQHPKIAKRPDLRGDITSTDGKQVIFCKVCNKETSYAAWSTHCITQQTQVR